MDIFYQNLFSIREDVKNSHSRKVCQREQKEFSQIPLIFLRQNYSLSGGHYLEIDPPPLPRPLKAGHFKGVHENNVLLYPLGKPQIKKYPFFSGQSTKAFSPPSLGLVVKRTITNLVDNPS